jgi:hypothetical protein
MPAAFTVSGNFLIGQSCNESIGNANDACAQLVPLTRRSLKVSDRKSLLPAHR